MRRPPFLVTHGPRCGKLRIQVRVRCQRRYIRRDAATCVAPIRRDQGRGKPLKRRPIESGELAAPDCQAPEHVTAVIEYCENIGEQDPAAAIKWAEVALDLTERLNSSLLGRAESIKGGALFLHGKYRDAEISLHRAAALLATVADSEGEAANLRRFAGLRATQKSFAESRRMLEVALSLSRDSSKEEYGKSLAALGVLEMQTGGYTEAAEKLATALDHLDRQKSGYAIAAHNLMTAMVMMGERHKDMGARIKKTSQENASL